MYKVGLQYFAGTPMNTTGTINTGTGSVATKPAAFYNKTLLHVFRLRQFPHSKFAQEKPMPKKYGDTVNFRRIKKLEPALEPLVEGVTPAGDQASISAISATTKQYGKPMYFTDVVDFQQIDPIITEYTVEQGLQAKETLDILVREELNAGSNVLYAGGKNARAELGVGDKPTINDFRRMRLSMIRNYVPQINNRFICFITPETAMDLMDDPKFEKAYEIGRKNTPFIEGEIADIYGIKFIEAVNAKIFEDSGVDGANVHSSIMIGKHAYGITKIKGEGDIQAIVKALGSAGTDDALNQRQSIGWKVNAFVAKRLAEEAIIRYEAVPSNA